MKIRTSYVSNSSSASFCIMGAVFEISNDVDILDAFDDYTDETDNPSLVCEEGLDEYYKQFVIGIPAMRMLDDETLKQFKSRVYKELKKFSKRMNVELGINEEDIEWRIDGGQD